MKHLVTILSLLLAVLAVQAQTDSARVATKKERQVELFGSVYDSFTKVPLKAHLTLMTAGDSAVVDTMTCWSWGTQSFYQFKVPARQTDYIIKGTCEGYEDGYLDYPLRHIARNNHFNLPRLLLKKRQDIYKEVGLDGVVITGTKVKIAYRGDTLVYNASAFNLPEGSMLDGLIRQMPGAELKKNGDIYINGRKVDYLLLNGKEFFRGQNKVMLDNLPYFTVQELKVYDKSTRQSERIGHDVERKDYVMDVVLKRNYNRGFLANAEVGAGTEDRYVGRVFSLYYDDHTRVSLFGNANNVNEDREPGFEGDWSPAEMPKGLRSTKMSGLHVWSEDADKRWEESLSASLTWSDAENEGRTASETFADGGSIFGGNWSTNRQKDFRFSASNDFSLEKLGLSSRFGIDFSNGHRNAQSSDSTMRDVLVNQVLNLNYDRYRTLTLNGHVGWFKKFEWGDFVSLSVEGNLNRQKPSDSYSIQDTRYVQSADRDYRHFYLDNHQESYNYKLAAGYTFQLPANWYIGAQADYSQAYQSNYNNYYRLDWLEKQKDDASVGTLQSALTLLPSTREALLTCLDTENTDDYQLTTRQLHPALTLSHTTDEGFFALAFPLNITHERIHYTTEGLDTVARRHYSNFMPSIMYSRWGRNFRTLGYHFNISQPDFLDLMPIDDSTNPLAYRLNNPELKPRIDHYFNVNWSWNVDSLKRSFGVELNAVITQRAWGTRTTYDPSTGAYAYMTDNINGNWNATLSGHFQQPVDRGKRLILTERASAAYVHSVDFPVLSVTLTTQQTGQQERSTVHNLTLSDHLGLTYQRDEFTASVSGNIAYRRSTSSREGFQRINAFDFDYGLTLNYTVPLVDVTVGTDLRMFSRRGYYSDMMNDNHLIWNAQLSRSFIKGRLTAKLQAFDLLHQLSDTEYAVNAQGRTETWHKCIPRYVMLSLAYKFTRKPKK